jgi:hypothetical protein
MMANGYPVRSDEVVWRDIGGEVVIISGEGAEVSMLNPTGSHIWIAADGTRALSDIATCLCDRFDISSDEALNDTLEFCEQLAGAGLVILLDAPVK